MACSRLNFTLPLHVTCQAVIIDFDKTFPKLCSTQQGKGNISLLVSFVIKNHSPITILLSLNSKHYWEEELVFLLYSEGSCIMLRGDACSFIYKVEVSILQMGIVAKGEYSHFTIRCKLLLQEILLHILNKHGTVTDSLKQLRNSHKHIHVKGIN